MHGVVAGVALDADDSVQLPRQHPDQLRAEARDLIRRLLRRFTVFRYSQAHLPGTMAHETRQTLTNMRHLLESAGSSLERVVKLNVLIYDMLEFENMNAVFKQFFPVDPPARTVCGVQLSAGMKIEIECIALASK